MTQVSWWEWLWRSGNGAFKSWKVLLNWIEQLAYERVPHDKYKQ